MEILIVILVMDMQQELQLIYGSSSQKYITITDSHNTGIISGGGNKGGIVAHANQGININRCYNTGKITGETGSYFGGIIGRGPNNCNILNSYNSGEITGKGSYVGGIIGRNEGTDGEVIKCYNIGNINCDYEYGYFGGIAGYGSSNFAINQSYNKGKIKGKANNIGGIAGASGRITNSYNFGKIEIEKNDNIKIGGITGQIDRDIIENCYNVGDIEYNGNGQNINSTYIGGICGDGDNIKNVYSIGNLINIPNGSMVGAIIGKIGQSAENLYYLKGVYSIALGNTSTSITAEEIETLEKMKAKLNSNLATLEGWKEVNNGYPILSWQ